MVKNKTVSSKRGDLNHSKRIDAICFEQFGRQLCLFSMKASELWNIVSINRHHEDKDEGYQRTLSAARVKSVKDYILDKNPIPTTVLISFPKAKFESSKGVLVIPKGRDVAWVVDGQHRLAGAHEAAKEGVDLVFGVVGVLNTDEDFEVKNFVTINREAKGVPTSLVYSLLTKLPPKIKSVDIANERASELGTELRRDADSIFANRIVVTSSPGPGQISLVNFVRKIAPLVHPEKGILNTLKFEEQKSVIENYFRAYKQVFPSTFRAARPIIWQTIGFGAVMNVFDTVFKESLTRYHGSFAISDIVKILNLVADFELESWAQYGTGSKAEIAAANDLRVDLMRKLASNKQNTIKLK